MYRIYKGRDGDLSTLTRFIYLNFSEDFIKQHLDEFITFKNMYHHYYLYFRANHLQHLNDRYNALLTSRSVLNHINSTFNDQEKSEVLYWVFNRGEWGIFRRFITKWKWPLSDKLFVRIPDSLQHLTFGQRGKLSITIFEFFWKLFNAPKQAGKKQDIECWDELLFNCINYGMYEYAKYLIEHFSDKFTYGKFAGYFKGNYDVELVDTIGTVEILDRSVPERHFSPERMGIFGMLTVKLKL